MTIASKIKDGVKYVKDHTLKSAIYAGLGALTFIGTFSGDESSL